ncbi:MAG: hypothetical protein H7Y27_01900, partial [Gemmatimonadaceae bacterium]|nr:hypothetical protein [Chitinophagaceae bacterium]
IYRTGKHLVPGSISLAKESLVKSSAKTTEPATDVAKTTEPKPAKRFEDLAPMISKEEFAEKARQKTFQFTTYLKILCDKQAPAEDVNKAINQSISLFVDENAIVETSSNNRKERSRKKIRQYLAAVKFLKYDKIEIEWSNVSYVSDIALAPDGNYYGTVTFEQTFRGFRDGKIVYEDVTTKDAHVIMKSYVKNVDGDQKKVWDILLSDIGVVSNN